MSNPQGRLRAQDRAAFRAACRARKFLTATGGVDEPALAQEAVRWLVREGCDTRETACSAARLALAVWQTEDLSAAMLTAMLRKLRRALHPAGPGQDVSYALEGLLCQTMRALPGLLPSSYPVEQAYFVRMPR